ncbi:MAG: tripartite tricarboxylate transporter substrate binding protein [Rhodoferax sp.]|nr:tripartite tricarboxylate transporter substrate binding protein [Rhodoferax sp.]
MKPILLPSQRHLLKAVLLCAATAGIGMAPGAFAQEAYPTKVVKFIANFPPGGPADILARSMGQALQVSLKQSFIIDNKPGAGGNLGADVVAKSPADGYTVLFGIDTTFTINPHIYRSMPFKPTDLKPVLIMASSGQLLGVSVNTGLKSMADLLAQGKTRKLNFSSAGSGSPGHMAVQLLNEATQLDVTHIPYKGNTPAVTAIVAAEVDGGILATPGMLPHVTSGKITPLAVTSSKRSRLLPDVPTVAEAKLKGLEQETLYVAMVPAATPEAVVQTLQRALLDALKKPEVQERLNTLDLHFEGQTGAAATQRLQQASDRYGRLARATGMKVE